MSATGFTHPEFLVETAWLAAHLADPNLVVLDCTTHLIPDPKITYTVKSGREDFEKGHIPGAQFLDLEAQAVIFHGQFNLICFQAAVNSDVSRARMPQGVLTGLLHNPVQVQFHMRNVTQVSLYHLK